MPSWACSRRRPGGSDVELLLAAVDEELMRDVDEATTGAAAGHDDRDAVLEVSHCMTTGTGPSHPRRGEVPARSEPVVETDRDVNDVARRVDACRSVVPLRRHREDVSVLLVREDESEDRSV